MRLNMRFVNKPLVVSIIAICIIFTISSCSEDSSSNNSSSETVPAIFDKIYGATSITSDGVYVTIKTNGMPDHTSPYYATSNSLYESYSGLTFGNNTFNKNPNSISSQSLTFKIPINPAVASNHAATPLGPIGVALNGVPLYNQYAGPNNQALTSEITSFDKYYGHPQQMGQYHYHVEPLYLTTVKSTKSGLMGFLLDGFPVYGPQEEDGSAIVSNDLDVYHGHTHSTLDFPNGTDAPYLNGNGYYGTAGTISQ